MAVFIKVWPKFEIVKMNLFNKKFLDLTSERIVRIYPKFNYLKINNKLLKDLKKFQKKIIIVI